LTPAPESLVQFGCVEAVQSHALSSDNDRVAINGPTGAGKTVGTPDKLRDDREIEYEEFEHSATVFWDTLH
jgi:hypothetical protein